MLTFAAPWALALFAVGGVIALFYFLRTRFHQQPVSSVFLWKRLVRTNEGGARLRRRSLLLLLLQLAAAALVVLALAGPEIVVRAPLSTGTVYVLDTSASMAAREESGSRLDRAARAILDDFSRHRGPVAVLAGDQHFDSSDGSGLDGFLAAVRAGQGEFAEEAAAARVRAWTQTHGGTWEGVLVSDGGVDRGGAVLYDALGGTLRTLDFAGQAPNLGLVDLRVGTEARFTLFSGFAQVQTVAISLTHGEDKILRKESVPPGTSSLAWTLPDAGTGLWTARLEDWNDALATDNTFSLEIDAPRPIRVVHLGEPDPFLEAAFPKAAYENRTNDGGDWDLVLADGALPTGRGSTVYLGIVPNGPVSAGPEVSGAVTGTAPGHVLSRWVPWNDLRISGGQGLIVPPHATVLAEVDGWPVAAEWSQEGGRYLALGFQTRNSNLGLTSVLPVLMRNLRQALVPQEGNPLAATLRVGQPTMRAGSELWRVDAGIDAARRDGQWELTARRAGTFRWTDGRESGVLAANAAPGESDTAPRAVPLPPPVPAPAGEASDRTMGFGWVLALAALTVLTAEWRFWNGRFHPKTNPRAAWFRAATAAAVVLALVGLSLPWPTSSRNAVVLIDVSDSQGRELIEKERQAALKYLGTLDGDDRAAVVVFGARPQALSGLLPPTQAKAVLEAASWDERLGGDTDFAAALATGNELLSGSAGSGLFLLFSDGRATRGGALADLEGSSRYPVFAVPFGRTLEGVAAEGLEIPPARAGERVAVKWNAWSSSQQSVNLEVALDGQVVQRRAVLLEAGANTQEFSLDAGGAGTHRVDVRVAGTRTEASGLLTVAGPAAVLVIQGPEASASLVTALERQGLTVRTSTAAALPDSEAGYQGLAATVFDNVPSALTKRQEKALGSWVSNGGGLLVIGGAASLGRGGYFASGLEELLPVSTDSRRRLQFTRTRLLFVVDHSGSMSEAVGNTTKIEAAVSGVARTLQDLSPQDEVGILQFDSEASWVLPFTPVSDKAAILDALGSFSQGGGTELTSALDEVMKVFSAPGPVKRHVVLLTDGQTGVDDAFYERFNDAMRDAEVSMTVLGIGDQINEPLLKSLATGTGGIYYRAVGPDIPELLHGEAIRVTRDQVQEGRFTAVDRDPDPALELGGPPPPVLGYLVTRPKPLARVGWAVPRSEGVDPLYADWRYGAGRVAVFTSDSGRRWLAPWSGRPEYNRFWGQSVKALSVAESKDLAVAVSVSASVAKVTVEAREHGRVRTGASLSVSHGLNFPMKETAPGHYEAEIPLTEPGLALFTVNDRVDREQATAWTWTPAGAETVRGGVDWAALSRITSATGGRLEPAASLSPPRTWSWAMVPLRDGLLTVSLLLLVVELARRSLSLVQLRQAVATVSAWWNDQKRPWVKTEAARPRTEAETDRRTREAYRYLAQRRKPNP